jgi:hypothetical protein
MAFAGEYIFQTEQRQISVLALCWPTVLGTWGTLTQSASTLHALRRDAGGTTTSRPGPKRSIDWLHDAAPQLCGSLQLEPSAMESTLAALVRRLPVRCVAAVVDQDLSKGDGAEMPRYRALFAECLRDYGRHLRELNQSACQCLIAARREGQSLNDAKTGYGEARAHVDDSYRLGALALAFWPDDVSPLPLELARLAAAAIGRHIAIPQEDGPLFDVFTNHMASSSRFHVAPTHRKRR